MVRDGLQTPASKTPLPLAGLCEWPRGMRGGGAVTYLPRELPTNKQDPIASGHLGSSNSSAHVSEE